MVIITNLKTRKPTIVVKLSWKNVDQLTCAGGSKFKPQKDNLTNKGL